MSTTDPFISSPTLSVSSSLSSFSSISSPSSLPDSDSDSDFLPISSPPSVHSLPHSCTSGHSMSKLSGIFGRLSVNNNNNNNDSSSSRRSNSSFSSFSSFSGIEDDSSGLSVIDPGLDPSTQLLIAQLTLADLIAYRATLKDKRPITRAPSDGELALQQQEAELRALITYFRDSALARSIDKAVESDAELIRALEVMERSEREDRRAAEVLAREDRLPRLTEAQSIVGRKGFVVPERNDDEDEDDNKTVIIDEPSSSSYFNRRTSTTRPPINVPALFRAPPKLECISCTEKFTKNQCITATCNHIYCHACIISLVEACIRDESLYPVKCCQQPFSRTQLGNILGATLRAQFEDKSREFGTPAQWRVYCCSPRCSAFLGSSSGQVDDVFCGSCRTLTCTGCKQSAHPRESCRENADAIKVREMAADKHWQTCPGCKAIIELELGCYHMTCRCRTEFCYLCAARWKTCQCPQWDEARLIVDARRRVENEMGRGVRYAEPRVFENHVRQRVEVLRTRHECVVHDWRNRQGGGECEQCGDYLPIFLKICRGCAMLVCRRCALNRL